MKRKKLSEDQIRTLASALVSRAKLASRLGIQFGGLRDIYKSFGYEKEIKYEDFLLKYARHDMAKAIIDRPVKATWQGPLDLMESGVAKDTEFERAWDELNTDIGLKSIFSRVDKLTGLGRYGILLLGLDDVKSRDGFAQPVKAGKRILKYLRPYGESTATIFKLDEEATSERYGKPLIYKLEVQDVKLKTSIPIAVHYTRVVHITDDLLESEVYGTPRLEAPFNRLIDLEKLVGGDAEMFWRGARPGYEAKISPDYQMTPQMREDLNEELDEYEADLRRFLVNEGVDIQALAQQIADPANHVDVQLTMISAVTGIPKRILSGSERGELSRHIHQVIFNPNNNTIWIQTGDGTDDCWIIEGTYDPELDTWSFAIVEGDNDGGSATHVNNTWYKISGIVFNGSDIYWSSDSDNSARRTIIKCAYADFGDYTKYEKVFNSSTQSTMASYFTGFGFIAREVSNYGKIIYSDDLTQFSTTQLYSILNRSTTGVMITPMGIIDGWVYCHIYLSTETYYNWYLGNCIRIKLTS